MGRGPREILACQPVRVVFSTLADGDFADAIETYEAARPGLGRDFARQVERALTLVVRYPDSAPRVASDFHRAVVNRFPFFILYAVLDRELYVAGILPTAADPKRFAARLASHS